MEEIGVVKSIDGVTARVIVERKSACDQCTEGKCLVTDGGAIIDAVNIAKASEGQRVRVLFKPYTYLKGAALIYGTPALALIIGAVIGKEFLSSFIQVIDPDLLSAASGFSLFIIAFVGVRLLSRWMEKKTEYKPVVEEILE